MGSASQCSMREEGGSKCPYLVPALGGSRGGRKYLKQHNMDRDEDDKHVDREKTMTMEYREETIQRRYEIFFLLGGGKKSEWQTIVMSF